MVRLEPNGSYSIDIRVNNKRIRERGFVTREAANDYINDLRTSKRYAKLGLKNPNEKEKPKTVSVKLADLFDKRLADLHHRQTIATLNRCKELLLSIVGENADVTDLTFQHLKEFNRQRGKQITQYDRQVEPSTVFREMTEISSMLSKAGEYFNELESYQPPKIPRPKVDKTRRERVITPKERDAILAQLNRPRGDETEFQYEGRKLTALCFEFALLTASRRKEVVKLKRSDHVPELDKLRIKRWKTIKAKADSVSIFSPVPNRVVEILEQRKVDSPDKVYLFSIDGHDDQQYLDDMADACELAGIPYGKYTEGGLVFHDARHTFVTNLIQEGVDLETVRELAGLSREMILRYAHSSPESKQKAAQIIDKWAKNGHAKKTKAVKSK